MLITLEHTATFRAVDAPWGFVDELERTLSVANPRHTEALARGAHPGNEPRTLCAVQRAGALVSVQRGAVDVVRKLAARYRLGLTFEDRRALGEPLDFEHARELRPYQARAVDEVVRRQQVLVEGPAGCGKTSMAAGMIARIRRSAIVLVGTVDLAEQWRAELRAQLGVEPGLIGSGQFEVRAVTVAIVASLTQLEDTALLESLGGFGLLVVDECHHAASPTWARVIGMSRAKFRVGLSATPEREDGLGRMVEWVIGPLVQAVRHADLLQSGALLAPDTLQLATEFDYRYRGPHDWAPMLDDLVRDAARNLLIVDAVHADATAGHSVLVLTGRVEHAEDLARILAARGLSTGALHGKKSKQVRGEMLERAKTGDLSVLVATQVADEGLDMPCLSRLYLTFPARAAGRLEQRIGRIMRPFPGKPHPAVIDVVDANVGVLRNQARKRAAVFAEILGTSGGGLS